MSEIDSLSAPDWHSYFEPGGGGGDAVGELVRRGVERVAGAGGELDLLPVPRGHAGVGARHVAEVHDAGHGSALAVVGVVAEAVPVVVVDPAQVPVGPVDLVVAGRPVVARARGIVGRVAAAVVVEDLARREPRVLVRVVRVAAGVRERLAAVGAAEDGAQRLVGGRADLRVQVQGEQHAEHDRHHGEHAGVGGRCLSALAAKHAFEALAAAVGRQEARGSTPAPFRGPPRRGPGPGPAVNAG